MKKLLLIVAILLLTGCTRGEYQSHSSYYIDGEGEYEEECECEAKDTLYNIERMLYDVIINPDDYSKNDMYYKIKQVYDLSKK